jgi:nicotinamidase-related amidase
MLQLRKQGVDKLILAGMLSNLCVESHLREFVGRGFEVAVVRDAVAGPRTPAPGRRKATATPARWQLPLYRQRAVDHRPGRPEAPGRQMNQ